MSQQNNTTFARRPQTMFNDYRYPMPASAKPVEGAKFPARWTWELTLGGGVAFKVNDGVWGPEDRNAKSKEVELSAMDRNSLFGLMEEAINNVNFTKAQYHVKKVTFGSGGRLNDHPSTLATFTVVRTGDGRISVGYTKGTYKVMFDFKSPYDSIIMVSGDGGEPREDGGLMSRVFCKAFIDYSRKFLDQAEWDGYKPREKKGGGDNNGGNKPRGNGNWGGGNSNGGGNSSWGGNNNSGGNNSGGQTQQRAMPDFDNEIDF